MIRAVLDANVLVSMFPASRGTMLDLRARWMAGDFQLVCSDYIVTEVRRAWSNSYWSAHVSSRTSQEFLTLLRRRAAWLKPHIEVVGVASYPADDPGLATAASAGADVLVTGDEELLRLRTYEGVRIVSARRFVELLDPR